MPHCKDRVMDRTDREDREDREDRKDSTADRRSSADVPRPGSQAQLTRVADKLHRDACGWASRARRQEHAAVAAAESASAAVGAAAEALMSAAESYEELALGAKTASRAATIAHCERKAADMAVMATERTSRAARAEFVDWVPRRMSATQNSITN